MKHQMGTIISLEEYRKSRRGQAILLKRLIEQHLDEIGKRLALTNHHCEDGDLPPHGSRDGG